MRKLLSFLLIISLLNYSCKRDVNIVSKEEASVQHPSCGMNEAMQKMLPEYRATMSRMAKTTAASELLLYLDFDGAVVRLGFPNSSGYSSPILGFGIANCPPCPLNAEQRNEVIRLAEDDFSPFNIIVTTDLNAFNSYPAANKHICIITTRPQVIGQPSNVGGVSPWAGPGIRLPFNPSFVFSQQYGGNLGDIAMTISHEVGHTLGLDHQHQYNEENCGFVYEYSGGQGTGPLSFTPIMGGGLNKRITNWWAQPCQDQNDFAAIHQMVELKEDDFPNTPTGNKSISGNEIEGILEDQDDVDYILLNFKGPGSVTVTSDNIDLKVSIVNPGGQVMAEYDDGEDINVIVPSANGKRYLKIEGISNVNLSSQFMTGKYKVAIN